MTNRPRRAQAQQNAEAWWYAMRGHIAIYIRTLPNGPTVTASISKRQLKSYLAQAERKP